MVHHDGGIDGFTSTLALLPEEGIGFSLLTNAQFSSVPQRSIDIAFATLLSEDVQEVVAEKEDPYTAEELQAFTGKYDFAAAKQVWTVFVDAAGRLALDYPDVAVYQLSWPDDAGRWAIAPQVYVVFHLDEAGAVAAMTLYNDDIEVRMPRKTTAGLPTVDDVFELTKKAMPPAATEAACPLRIEGTVALVHEGLSGRFELLYQDDEHWRFDKRFGKFGRTTTVVDGGNGWSFTTMRGREEMSATEYAGAKRDAPFSTLAGTRDLYRSLHVVDVEGEGDDKRILLRAIPFQGPPVTIRIDAEGAVRRSDGAFALGELATIPVETVYADIRDVQGIRLAHHVEVCNPLTGVTRVVTEKFESNVEVPATAWEE